MAGRDQDGTFGVAKHVFGYAAEQHTIQAGPTVSCDHDEISSGVTRCAADLIDRVACANLCLGLHVAEKIKLRKSLHVKTGIFQIDGVILI